MPDIGYRAAGIRQRAAVIWLQVPVPDNPVCRPCREGESVNQFAMEIVLFVCSVTGVLIGVLGLPGNFVPVAAALVAVLWGNGTDFTWMWFVIFLLVAASGEVLEQITGAVGARKSGASRAGMLGAVLGGLLGGIAGTVILPVIGSFVGVFLGCFTLTFVFEYVFARRSVGESTRSGFGAVAGKAAAIAYKFVAGFVLLILMAWRFWGAA